MFDDIGSENDDDADATAAHWNVNSQTCATHDMNRKQDNLGIRLIRLSSLLYRLPDSRAVSVWIKKNPDTRTSREKTQTKEDEKNIKRKFSSNTKYYNKVILLSHFV